MPSDARQLGEQLSAVARPAVDMVVRKIQESRDRNEPLICSAEALEMMALVAELAKVGLEHIESHGITGVIQISGSAKADDLTSSSQNVES